jgi:soluble lytic murein transglycosylase-like protein
MRAAATALALAFSTAIPASAFDPVSDSPPFYVKPYAAPGAVQAPAPSGKVQSRIAPGQPLAFVAPFATHPHAGIAPVAPHGHAWDAALDARIAAHASAAGVPIELARRVVKRESNGNARAVSKGNYGLMQIRLGTAKAMGYRGNAQGLLDAETNMTYAMKYLAGAYRAAGGNHDRAVALYARGYYYEAKKMGFSAYEAPRAAGLAPVTLTR